MPISIKVDVGGGGAIAVFSLSNIKLPSPVDMENGKT